MLAIRTTRAAKMMPEQQKEVPLSERNTLLPPLPKSSTQKKHQEQHQKNTKNKKAVVFDHFQVVIENDPTDMMIRLSSSPNCTFKDLRREIEEDIKLPFANFRFTVEANGMGVYTFQEKKWKVRDYDLTNQGDGSYKMPYSVFIKEAK